MIFQSVSTSLMKALCLTTTLTCRPTGLNRGPNEREEFPLNTVAMSPLLN